MEPKYFEDLVIGEIREHPGLPVTAEEIMEFGRKFDPEPFHTDPEAAAKTMFGGLVASGAHTFALWRRMDWETVRDSGWIILAGAGLDEMRLLLPVRPGDVLHLRSELIEKIPSRSKPDRGLIISRETLLNQNDEVVMTMIGKAMAARRPE